MYLFGCLLFAIRFIPIYSKTCPFDGVPRLFDRTTVYSPKIVPECHEFQHHDLQEVEWERPSPPDKDGTGETLPLYTAAGMAPNIGSPRQSPMMS